MHLRTIIFFTSVVMIGFCLSLYFQAGNNVQSVNWDQYKDLQYNEERSHSLAEFNEKIAPYKLQNLIQTAFEKNKINGDRTRVMELGAGNGRVLMELKKLFPEVEFYGINKEKTHTFYRRESFILTALKFEIFTKQDIEGIDLPYVVFQDLDFGARIPYNENKFDVIYSQAMLSHIKYKFELFNEIMRVLKPEGVSYHTDVHGITIYARGVVLDLRDAMAELRRRSIEINALENKASLRFKKPKFNVLFPVTPHQPVPENLDHIPKELRRPEMGYNLNY